MGASFQLAVGQAPANLEGPTARLEWLKSIMPQVADARADLLLLPELFACGCNIGEQVAHLAEAADGPTAMAIGQLARTHRVAIHYGFAEREGERLFNAALCLGPNGDVIGHHRKLAIPPGFEREHFTSGRGRRLFDLRGWKVATLICYDAEFAETVRHVADLGAELVLVPTALGSEWDWVSRTMIPTRAYENGVYLGYANSAGTEHNMTFLGKSLIAAPDGKEAARAGEEPEIIYAYLHKSRVRSAQMRLPYLQDRSSIKFR